MTIVARTQLRNSTRVIFPFELHVSNWTVLLNIRSTYALSAQQFAISRSTQIKIFRNFCYCLTFAQNMESLFICFIYIFQIRQLFCILSDCDNLNTQVDRIQWGMTGHRDSPRGHLHRPSGNEITYHHSSDQEV